MLFTHGLTSTDRSALVVKCFTDEQTKRYNCAAHLRPVGCTQHHDALIGAQRARLQALPRAHELVLDLSHRLVLAAAPPAKQRIHLPPKHPPLKNPLCPLYLINNAALLPPNPLMHLYVGPLYYNTFGGASSKADFPAVNITSSTNITHAFEFEHQTLGT